MFSKEDILKTLHIIGQIDKWIDKVSKELNLSQYCEIEEFSESGINIKWAIYYSGCSPDYEYAFIDAKDLTLYDNIKKSVENSIAKRQKMKQEVEEKKAEQVKRSTERKELEEFKRLRKKFNEME